MPVVINSRFTPLTYDEITRPLIEQTQAQEALENAYMEASDQASQIMAQANEQTDPIAYARLKNYSEALQQQAESLMRQGLNRNSRQSLINMRRRYNQDIMPIKSAVERRNTLADEQRKLRVAHPDMLFERDMNTTSLDAFLQNPQLDFGRSYSGLQIQSDVERAIQAVTQGMGSVTVGGSLGNGVRELIKRTGADPEFVEEQIRQGVDANTIFGHIAQSALNKSGVGEWNNAAALNQAKNYALQGYYSGYGKVDRSIIEDYDKRRRDALSDYRARLQMQQDIALGTSGQSSSKDSSGNTWSEATALRVKGTGEKVYVRRDADGNIIYSVRGEKNGKFYPHTVIDASQIEEKSTSSSSTTSKTKKVAIRKNPIVVTVANTKGNKTGRTKQYDKITDIEQAFDAITYDEIARNPEWMKIVSGQIGDADPSNFDFYIFEEDAEGRGTGDDTKIVIAPKLGSGSSADIDEDAL